MSNLVVLRTARFLVEWDSERLTNYGVGYVARFMLDGVRFDSSDPGNAGEAETINNALAQLQRAIDAETELADLLAGRRVVLPRSPGHAKAMALVAATGLEHSASQTSPS